MVGGPERPVRRPVLCLVTDPAATRHPLAEAVAAALRGGVDWVQLRDRRLGGRALLACLESLRRAAPKRGVWLVNRRADVALAGGADGVHLGFDALGPCEARTLLGGAVMLGTATHEPDELADLRRREALDYAHLAPIFAPISKRSTRPSLGVRALARAARFGLPVLAQGGITAANARSCIEAGAAGVAVTGAILAAEDPEAAARALRDALD